MSQRLIWTLVTAGAAVIGGAAARAVLKVGWKAATNENPPNNPAEPGTSWGQAMVWAALTGTAVGIARVLARRGAALGLRKLRN